MVECVFRFHSFSSGVVDGRSLFSYCWNTTCGTSSGDTAGLDWNACGSLSPVDVRLTPAPKVFRDAPALLLKGRSFRDWKLRGLRPRTTMAPDCASARGILPPVERVARIFNLITKCCCNSFLRPLLAVAILNCSLFHCMGKVAQSASKSDLPMVSRGIEGGSFSALSSVVVGAPPAGVFQGTEISLTGLPSTDSVADTVSS